MIKVFDVHLDFLGFLSGVENFQHTAKLGDVGTFSFSVPFTEDYLNICALNNIIYYDEDVSGIILSRSIDVDKDTIEVSGKTLEEILNWRPYTAQHLIARNINDAACYYTYSETSSTKKWLMNDTSLATSGSKNLGVNFSTGWDWDLTRSLMEAVQICFGISNTRSGTNIYLNSFYANNWPIENMTFTYDSLGFTTDLHLTDPVTIVVPKGSTVFDFIKACNNTLQGIIKITFTVNFNNKTLNLHFGRYSTSTYTISTDSGKVHNVVLTESSQDACNYVWSMNTQDVISGSDSSAYPDYAINEYCADSSAKGLDLRIKTMTSSTQPTGTYSSVTDKLYYTSIAMNGEGVKYAKAVDYLYDCIIDTEDLGYTLRLGDVVHIIDKKLHVTSDRIVSAIQTTLADDNTPIKVYTFSGDAFAFIPPIDNYGVYRDVLDINKAAYVYHNNVLQGIRLYGSNYVDGRMFCDSESISEIQSMFTFDTDDIVVEEAPIGIATFSYLGGQRTDHNVYRKKYLTTKVSGKLVESFIFYSDEHQWPNNGASMTATSNQVDFEAIRDMRVELDESPTYGNYTSSAGVLCENVYRVTARATGEGDVHTVALWSAGTTTPAYRLLTTYRVDYPLVKAWCEQTGCPLIYQN